MAEAQSPTESRGERGGGQRGGRPRLPRRNVVVDSAERVTPNLVRLECGGELDAWDVAGPGAHFKVFVPEDGSEELAMRTYTVRAYDAATRRLTLEFGLHADGPATNWARDAAPGDGFQISGQARSGYVPAEAAQWCVLVADHSALPAAAAVLEALPARVAATAIVELTDAADALELRSDAPLETEWVLESGAPCSQLVRRVRELELPPGPGEVWVGCEAGAMREIRRHLLQERGLAPGSMHTRAYWKQSVANHSDHDTGEGED